MKRLILTGAAVTLLAFGLAGPAGAAPGDFTPRPCPSTAKFKVSAGAYTSCSLARNAAKAVEAKQIRFHHLFVISPVTSRSYDLSVGCGSDGRLMLGGGSSSRPVEILLAWKRGRCTS